MMSRKTSSVAEKLILNMVVSVISVVTAFIGVVPYKIIPLLPQPAVLVIISTTTLFGPLVTIHVTTVTPSAVWYTTYLDNKYHKYSPHAHALPYPNLSLPALPAKSLHVYTDH